MNKELCHVLRNKIADMPFIDLLAGMVQTLTTESQNEDNSGKVIKRIPVSYDVLGADCEGREVFMGPESVRKSVIYFEDYGISATGRVHGLNGYNSSLRLIVWLNRANLVGDNYFALSGRVMAALIDRLAGHNPENIDIFTRLTIEVARIPQQDAALFGRYTYNETELQYLRPPFEFFGIDLTCKYFVPSKCMENINWNNPACF